MHSLILHVYGSWFTKHSLRALFYESWFTNHGLRIMVYEPWFTSHGLQSIVYEPWFTSHGLRSIVYEPWFTEAEVNPVYRLSDIEKKCAATPDLVQFKSSALLADSTSFGSLGKRHEDPLWSCGSAKVKLPGNRQRDVLAVLSGSFWKMRAANAMGETSFNGSTRNPWELMWVCEALNFLPWTNCSMKWWCSSFYMISPPMSMEFSQVSMHLVACQTFCFEVSHLHALASIDVDGDIPRQAK